jgi:hypothetical protein
VKRKKHNTQHDHSDSNEQQFNLTAMNDTLVSSFQCNSSVPYSKRKGVCAYCGMKMLLRNIPMHERRCRQKEEMIVDLEDLRFRTVEDHPEALMKMKKRISSKPSQEVCEYVDCFATWLREGNRSYTCFKK